MGFSSTGKTKRVRFCILPLFSKNFSRKGDCVPYIGSLLLATASPYLAGFSQSVELLQESDVLYFATVGSNINTLQIFAGESIFVVVLSSLWKISTAAPFGYPKLLHASQTPSVITRDTHTACN